LVESRNGILARMELAFGLECYGCHPKRIDNADDLRSVGKFTPEGYKLPRLAFAPIVTDPDFFNGQGKRDGELYSRAKKAREPDRLSRDE
jgi:hypothetical protein